MLSAACSGAAGCDRLAADETAERPQWQRAHEPTEAETSNAGDISPPTERAASPPPPIERSEAKLYFPAKASTNFGFGLSKLSRLHALAGTIEVLSWSAPGEGDPQLARDDDIATAWRCTPTKTTPCALGLSLPAAARVKALRIYAATPEGHREALRPVKVRVHTDEGFVDAPVPEDPTHIYLVFGQYVRTRTVAIEVLESRGEKGSLRLAELEAYGVDGEPREPWAIDPRRTFVRTPDDPWAPTAQGWRLRSSVLETIEPDGTTRRLMAGTALVGRHGDRMLLLERIDETTCDRHEGTFFLIDQQTRMVAPLGSLGGAGAELYRHARGLGFAVGHHTPARTLLHGIVLENDAYRRMRTPARLDRREVDFFAAWSLDDEPLRRGGAPSRALPEGCELGSDDRMTELAAALGRTAFESRPGQWTVCELGDDATAYLTVRAPCGTRYELHVIGAGDGEQPRVISHDGKGKGTHLRLERAASDLLLAEIGQSNGSSKVFRIDPEGIATLGKGTSLALRPPPGCRKACDDSLVNPHEN